MSKSDLVVMQEMAKADMDIACSTNLVGGKKVKQGGIIEIGIAPEVWSVLSEQMVSGNVTHYVIAYIINKEQFDKLKGE
jgi:hypothetical protein